jgi:hypothetical protein
MLIQVVNVSPISICSELVDQVCDTHACGKSIVVEYKHRAGLHAWKYPCNDICRGLIDIDIYVTESNPAVV